jgi:hypothetical protein
VANWVANTAKGKFAYYGTLPATNDAIIVIPLETTGLEADSTLKDSDDVAALLAGSSNEQTTMGRKTAASVTVTVDDTGDSVSLDCADIVWTAATGNAISKLLFAYDPDTTTGTDSSMIPLVALDFTITPDGSDVTAQINAAGIATAS